MNFDHILHRADGTLVELNSQVGTFRAVTSERLTAVRQDVSSAELTLVSSEAFTVSVGDWIQAKGIRLYCMSTIDKYTCSEDNNREYQLTFYDPIYYLRQAIFYNTSENENEGVYSYSRVDNTYPSVGTFEDFVKLCCYNCNSVQGVRLFKVGTISEDIATDIRVITFSDYNCLAVLKQSCESFETTWKVRVNEDPEPDSVFVIDFGVEIEDFPVTLKVEHAQGLTSIDVTASDKDVFTQFVVKGGTDNLPSDYPYPNLQLDEDPSSTPPILANSMIKLPDLYSRWGKSIKELTYEDIKPSRTGTVTSISENILKFTDSDLIGAAWSPVGGTIHFVSGHLIGFTFNCQDFNSATGEITIESTEENNGFVLPSTTDSYYRINELDKYNIAGVSLPSSYITAAKTALKERALLGIDYWSQPRMQYAITIDPKIISVEIVPNMGFHIEHSALGIDKVINVQQVVYDLSKDSPYDIESIIISDLKTDDSKADSTHRQVATNRNIVNGTGANNVYSAKLLSRQRILDDYAKSQGLPNWGTFMEILSSGKGLWKDEDGNWWLNVAAIKAGAIGAELINVTQLIANEVFIGGVEDTAAALDDAIQVGGRNLIIKSATTKGFYNQQGIFTSSVYGWISDFIEVSEGKEYTAKSFNSTNNVGGRLIYFDADKTYVTRGNLEQEETFVIPTGVGYIRYQSDKVGGVYVDDAIIVKGNKATDWTPAPEDVQAEIDTASTAAKDAIAQEAGYTDFADMESKAALTVNGLLNSQIINVDDLFANTAFISKLLLEDGFIENLTVKFLETVGDANGYKVQIENSLNSEGAGESYVRLVNSDGTRKAELVFDPTSAYGDSGGFPVLRITGNGCYSRVFSDCLEVVSTTSGRFSYNMLSQFTPFGMFFATGTHAGATVKGRIDWDRNAELVWIYVNNLARGGFGTVSEGFLYRSPDGLNNDVIRYQS